MQRTIRPRVGCGIGRHIDRGIARRALLVACASSACLACSSNHRLGDLTQVDLGENPEPGDGSTANTRDFLAPAEIGPPGISVEESGGVFPYFATSIGDFDGDGYEDIVSRDYYLHAFPYARIRYGGPRPSDIVEELDFAEGGAHLMPTHAFQYMRVMAVGDVDADGFSDFIALFTTCVEPFQAYLFYGGADRLEGEKAMADVGVLLESPPTIPVHPRDCSIVGGWGSSSAELGDIDGDGFDDFALAVPQPVTFDDRDIVPLRNVAYLFYGRAERIPSGTSWLSADARLSSPRQTLELVPTGDINGDGLADLILGAEFYDVNALDEQPGSYLLPEGYFWLPGQTQRLSGDLELADIATATLPRAEAAGDLDGDGVRDIFLFDDANAPHLFYGAAGLFDAGADLAAADATFQPYAGEPHANLVVVRDLDGDGDDELVSTFGLGDYHPEQPRNVAVLSGTATRMSGAVQLAKPTNPFPDQPVERTYVEAVFSAGDFNGDGAADVLTRSGSYNAVIIDPLQVGPRTSVSVDGVTYQRYSFTGGQLNIHYGTPGELAAPLR